MWEYQGNIVEGILPAAGGQMRVAPDGVFYIFDPLTPARLELMPRQGADPDTYKPQFTEAWMNDSEQRLNRRTVRVLGSRLNGPTEILFQEYGQNGFWWTSADLSRIYVLVQWYDYTKNEPTNLFFWRSENQGQTFTQVDLKTQKLGQGEASGMYFDEQGVNGYILVDENLLWQTCDGGANWQKRYIPYSGLGKLPFAGLSADCAMVDLQGNLVFSLYKQNETTGQLQSEIYEVPADNETIDLNPMRPKHIVQGKRILNMAPVPGEEGFYLTYLECGGATQCNWENELTTENPALHFGWLQADEFKVNRTFNFTFLPVEEFYTGADGQVAAILKMPNFIDSKWLLSRDYGNNWRIADITEQEVISHYLDFGTQKYWQHRRGNEVYVTELPPVPVARG